MVKNRWNSSAKKKWFAKLAQEQRDGTTDANAANSATDSKKAAPKSGKSQSNSKTRRLKAEPLKLTHKATEPPKRSSRRRGVPAFAPPSPTKTAAAMAAIKSEGAKGAVAKRRKTAKKASTKTPRRKRSTSACCMHANIVFFLVSVCENLSLCTLVPVLVDNTHRNAF